MQQNQMFPVIYAEISLSLNRNESRVRSCCFSPCHEPHLLTSRFTTRTIIIQPSHIAPRDIHNPNPKTEKLSTQKMDLSIIFYLLNVQLISAYFGLKTTQRKQHLTGRVNQYFSEIKMTPEFNVEVTDTECTVTLFQDSPGDPKIPVENALILVHQLHNVLCDIKEITISWYGNRKVRLVSLDPIANTKQIIDSLHECDEGKILERYVISVRSAVVHF